MPTGLAPPTLLVNSRTDTSVTIVMEVPALSSTDVLGYQVFTNEPNTNAVPTKLAYDG